MLIAALLCLCAAVVVAALGLSPLVRSRGTGLVDEARRAVAPTRLAAALMLGAGGVVALAATQPTALIVLIVCLIGALGTVAAGSWQGARFAVERASGRSADCAGSCASCTQSCH